MLNKEFDQFCLDREKFVNELKVNITAFENIKKSMEESVILPLNNYISTCSQIDKSIRVFKQIIADFEKIKTDKNDV